MGIDKHRRQQHQRTSQFVQLFHYMIDCPSYGALRPVARAALVEVARLYNGGNNGMLAMSSRRLATRLGTSKDTAARALNALEAGGFIKVIKVGSFATKKRRATEYRLTFQKCDVTRQPPSRDFMNRGSSGSSSERSQPEDSMVRKQGQTTSEEA